MHNHKLHELAFKSDYLCSFQITRLLLDHELGSLLMLICYSLDSVDSLFYGRITGLGLVKDLREMEILKDCKGFEIKTSVGIFK